MLPYLTADLPGIGGRLKVQIEDFIVEEIPAYEPSGAGEHLYLWVEKRDMGTEFLQKQLTQRLGIRREEIGTAGMKDRRAVTRQWISVPLAAASKVEQANSDDLRILRVSRHGNKLRPGHLRGNRFEVLIRDVAPERASDLDCLVARLTQLGFPNYYGEQRFGYARENLSLGLAVLKGERPPPRDRFLRKIVLSAVQSELFNRCLAARLKDGLLHKVLQGDLLAMWPQGGCFSAEEPEKEQGRLDRHEVVSTGPMFGRKMMEPKAQVAVREAACLAEAGLDQNHFQWPGGLLDGTRRPLLCYLTSLGVTWEPEGARLKFDLPSGSYATVLLDEIMKP